MTACHSDYPWGNKQLLLLFDTNPFSSEHNLQSRRCDRNLKKKVKMKKLTKDFYFFLYSVIFFLQTDHAFSLNVCPDTFPIFVK